MIKGFKMLTFNLSIDNDSIDQNTIRESLISSTYSHSLKIFKKYIDEINEGEDRFRLVKKLLGIYSSNLVSIYLHEFNTLNNLNNGTYNPNTFNTKWENSNVLISIEDFENFQNSMNEKFSNLFIEIEQKLFSIKQISPNGEAVNLTFKLEDHFSQQNLEYKYNSLKKAICFYLTA